MTQASTTGADGGGPRDRDTLAGELALGLLEGPERAAALRLMLADRDFAARVEEWRAHQSGLFDGIDEVEPPADAWDGIAQRIGAPEGPPSALTWWKWSAIGSSAVAAALALMLVIPRSEPVPAATSFAVAQLTGPIEGLRIATRYDPATATLRVQTIGMPDTPTDPVLWVVPAGGTPVELGQIGRRGETVIVVPQGHRSLINAAARFSLSMEPRSPAPRTAPSAGFAAEGAIDLI